MAVWVPLPMPGAHPRMLHKIDPTRARGGGPQVSFLLRLTSLIFRSWVRGPPGSFRVSPFPPSIQHFPAVHTTLPIATRSDVSLRRIGQTAVCATISDHICPPWFPLP